MVKNESHTKRTKGRNGNINAVPTLSQRELSRFKLLAAQARRNSTPIPLGVEDAVRFSRAGLITEVEKTSCSKAHFYVAAPIPRLRDPMDIGTYDHVRLERESFPSYPGQMADPSLDRIVAVRTDLAYHYYYLTSPPKGK